MNQLQQISAPEQNIVYPKQLIEQLQQTRKKRVKLQGRTKRLAAEGHGTPHLTDFCKILSFSYDAKSNLGFIDTLLSITQSADTITMTGVLLDMSNESVVGELPPQHGSGLCCELKGPFTLEHPVEDPESLAVLVNADWIDSEGETEMALFHENSLSGDVSYEHEWPNKERVPQRVGTQFLDRPPYDAASREISTDTTPIILAFKRAPDAQTDVDYICGFGTIGDDHPNFGVPGRGTMRVEKGKVVLKDGVPVARATCSVVRVDGGGGIEEEYDFEYPGSVFSDAGGGLHYNMITGWNQRYKGSGGFQKVLFDYHLEITAQFTVNTHVQWASCTVTSRSEDTPSKNTQIIPKLQIMWGCLAEGTLIDRTDGTSRPIEQIRIGDLIAGRNGAVMRVTNVWRGVEDALVVLVTKQGTLRLTENHPVLTEKGWYHAADLLPGMAVLNRDGAPVPLLEVYTEPYDGPVCNLDLLPVSGPDRLEEHVMLANGLCVSDNRGQNELDCISDEKRQRSCDAGQQQSRIEQIERLKRHFGGEIHG